jgi:hypothetical protein
MSPGNINTQKHPKAKTAYHKGMNMKYQDFVSESWILNEIKRANAKAEKVRL